MRNVAATIAAAALIAGLAACGGEDAPDAMFCAIAEGSGSTKDASVRSAYAAAFDSDVTWSAEQPGVSPMCLILAVGAPAANPIATLPIRTTDPHAPDAEQIVQTNIETAKSQFAQILASLVDGQGTPLVEALFSLAQRAQLRPGDTIAVYSDMRQDSTTIRVFQLAKPDDAAAQNESIQRALDRLEAGGVLPDGRDGRPSLDGVRIVVPVPGATAPRMRQIDPKVESARQVAVHDFWIEWARRTGARLEWGSPASGSRGQAA